MTTSQHKMTLQISLPVGSRIILMSGTGNSRVYEVETETRTEVTVLDFKRNKVTSFAKAMLLACYVDGLAMFVAPQMTFDAAMTG